MAVQRVLVFSEPKIFSKNLIQPDSIDAEFVLSRYYLAT